MLGTVFTGALLLVAAEEDLEPTEVLLNGHADSRATFVFKLAFLSCESLRILSSAGEPELALLECSRCDGTCSVSLFDESLVKTSLFLMRSIDGDGVPSAPAERLDPMQS